jgi:hypothetical protein
MGRRRWAIPDGYIPPYGHGDPPQLVSHDAICLLNAGDRDAHVTITVYYADREPGGPQHTRLDSRQAETALLTTVAYAD